MSGAKRVAIVGTGGTISSRYDAVQKRTLASQEVDRIVALLPEQDGLPELDLEDYATIPSFNMTTAFAYGLIRHVAEIVRRNEVDGVVVTQGTDTLEETSFLADLLIDTAKPIIFTGAQLAHDHPQSDGPRNLLDSIRAAAADAAAGLGAMVCFNGQLHAGRDVTKVHTSALETFQSYDHGALGIVDGPDVVIHRRPVHRLHLAPRGLDKRVELIKAVLGIDSRQLDAARAMGADGVVIEGFGRGNVTAELGKGLARACGEGFPIVLASRCPSGRVKPVYGGGGGGRDLEDAGVIFAGDLRGPKARLLLMAALDDPDARGRLGELFRVLAP